MNKKTIIGICCGLFITITIFELINFCPSKSSSIVKSSNSFEANKTELFGDVMDYKNSLEEVNEDSDLIVIGEVISNWQFSEYAVKSKVKVLKTLRGKEYNEIDITQLGSLGQECILVEGQKYMLLLGNQNEPNNDYTFYIKGEIQGKILIKDDEPIAADIVIEKDIKSIIRKNKENKKGIEKLNDYFMNETTTPQNGN